jgi:prepilin-type N-terminal cleavage/methylation domain-containing protein
MQKQNRGGAGFTLIELLAAVLIIGILMAAAVPQYKKAVMKTRLMKYFTYINTIAHAHETYYMANNAYAKDVRDLDVDLPHVSEYKQGNYTQRDLIAAYFQDGTDCGPTGTMFSGLGGGCIVKIGGQTEFWIYKAKEHFYCGGYTQQAADVCQTMSDGTAPSAWETYGLYTVQF